jgi:biotin carboxylase
VTRKLLVLAASVYQIPAILKARAIGLEVITADNRPSNPGHRLAHRSFDIDIRDREAVLELARHERVDGVLSPCSDVGTLTVSYVATRLGLPGPPYEACRVLMNKVEFRRFLVREGLPAPHFAALRPGSEPELPAGDGPWIVKPADSSGSKGSRIVHSREELVEALPECFEHSAAQLALLESFLEGTQGTCEGVLVDGRIRLMAVLDRITAPRPWVATAGHLFPCSLDASTQEGMRRMLEGLWAKFGIRDTVFDCDFISQGGEVHILEMTPRLGGNSIERLIEETHGLDLGTWALRHAAGMPAPDLPSRPATPACNIILGVPEEGFIDYDEDGLRGLQGEDWVVDISLDHERGDRVSPFVNGRRRVGHAMVRGRTREELAGRRAEVLSRLDLRVRATPPT